MGLTSYRHDRNDVTKVMCQAPHDAPGRTLQLDRCVFSHYMKVMCYLVPVMCTVVSLWFDFYLQSAARELKVREEEAHYYCCSALNSSALIPKTEDHWA